MSASVRSLDIDGRKHAYGDALGRVAREIERIAGGFRAPLGLDGH